MKTTRKLLYIGLLLPLLSGMQLDANHTTDLHQALQNQDITAALDYIKNSNQEELNQRNKEQASPLHLAAQKGYNTVITDLLEKKAAINIKNPWGNTPLHLALKHDQTEVVKILIQYGANINSLNNKNESPLHVAVAQNNIEAVEALITAKAKLDVQNTQQQTPLDLAIQSLQSEDIALLLIESGANPTVKNNNLETALHWAMQLKRKETAKALIQNNYNNSINIKNMNGDTPLHIAVTTKQSDIIELLTAHGADLNVQNNDGRTALHSASLLVLSFPIIKLLVENGTDLTLEDKRNKKATDLAVNYRDYKLYLDSTEEEYQWHLNNPYCATNTDPIINNKSFFLLRSYGALVKANPSSLTNMSPLIDIYTLYKTYHQQNKLDLLEELLKGCNFAKFTGKQQIALNKTGLPLTKNQLHLQNGLLQAIESDAIFSDMLLITKK